jgi:hypothetical protein
MTTMWLARLVACLPALLTGNVTPASASPTATTTNSLSAYVYNGAAIARVDDGEFEAAAATPAQLCGPRDGSASSLAAALESSTTPSGSFIATNTVSGARGRVRSCAR